VWFHSIDLGDGVITPGRKGGGLDYMKRELDALRLPDLEGKSVLDIGAWDGFYSFQAERLGASRVVALDDYAWSVDFGAETRPAAAAPVRADVPERFRDAPHMWAPERLPGKRGFDVAHQALGSEIEAVVANFMEMELDALGTFDVVLYLGVLYHMEDPLRALRRVAAVTREMAVVETAGVRAAGLEDRALCEFFESDELEGDPSNWWAPNARALAGLCRAAGFRRAEVVEPLESAGATPEGVQRGRLVAHAWR